MNHHFGKSDRKLLILAVLVGILVLPGAKPTIYGESCDIYYTMCTGDPGVWETCPFHIVDGQCDEAGSCCAAAAGALGFGFGENQACAGNGDGYCWFDNE